MSIQQLKMPFPKTEVKWRVGRSGVSNGRPWVMALAYIDSRAVQERLDEVVGPFKWQDKYSFGKQGEIVCSLGIKVEDEWVWKSDGAGQTNFEAEKGGLSDAFKRSAVKWGIGRYLYNLTESFADVSRDKKKGYKYIKIDGNNYYWKPPELPSWALPDTKQKIAKRKNKIQAIAAIVEENPTVKKEVIFDYLTERGYKKDTNELKKLSIEKLAELIRQLNEEVE